MAGSSYLPDGADAKRAGVLAALDNAAAAASRVAGIAGQWASCLADADVPCPSVRLSANLHPEDAKQFGMLRRAMPTVAAARSAAGYGGCVSGLLSAYGEQLRTLERICGAQTSSASGVRTQQTVFARLREALARLRKALSRGGAEACGAEEAARSFADAFRPVAEDVREREDWRRSQDSPCGGSAAPPCGSEATAALDRLHRGTAFLSLDDGDGKLRMGLAAMSEFVRACVAGKDARLFGCPLFMRTVYEVAQAKGKSIKPAEAEDAEGLWTGFRDKLRLALSVLKRHGLEGTAQFAQWLGGCGGITGKVGGYTFYRGIRHDVLDGLLSHCRSIAVRNHAECEETIEMLYCGIFDGIEAMPAFLPLSAAAPRTGSAADTPPHTAQAIASGAECGDDGVPKALRDFIVAETNRGIKAHSRRVAATETLIRHSLGEKVNPVDRRKPSERRQIDEVVEMYVKKHDIEGIAECSVRWCCMQTMERGEDGRYDGQILKKLHNAVSYDMKNYYDMSAVRARVESRTDAG